MKLSKLVELRNRIDKFPLQEVKLKTNEQISMLMHTLDLAEIFKDNHYQTLQGDHENILRTIDQFGQNLSNFKEQIQLEINKLQNQYFADSYTLFEKGMRYESNETVLNRRLSITGENTKHASYQSELILRNRLDSYNDWRFPGIVLRPGLENFIEHMVGFDPLYILDKNTDLLKPCLEMFPQQYQNRLRPYTFDEYPEDESTPYLEKIPNGQFGLCLAYNFMNYKPFEVFRKWLTEIYQKLRPGGILLMTYNECDQTNAVELVEKTYACYTPGYLVKELAASIGFYQTHTWGDGGPSVWLELRKPGKLYSIRGGQTLAQIKGWEEIQRDLDFIRKRAYTEEEIIALHEKATSAGVRKSEYIELETWQWEGFIDTKIAEREDEAKRKEEQERLRIETERKLAIAELQEYAYKLGINPDDYSNEHDLRKKVNEVENTTKKKDLAQLRRRALELEVGPPNLIKYGYSADKLIQLITEREIADREVVLKQQREEEEKRQQQRSKIFNRARELGINPDICIDEHEVLRKIKAVEKILKDQEFERLKEKALELNVADPDLIRYTYTQEKLIELIKEKEKK